MPNNQSSINLAKEEISPFDNFINWTLTIGRIIVIITEIIAVAAFIYRFSLDERLVNLHSAIKQRENILSSFKTNEEKFRNLQNRIALAGEKSEKGITVSKSIVDFGKLIPAQASIDVLTFNNKQINITVFIPSISTLADTINAIKTYSLVKSISIDSIETKEEGNGLTATITVNLK